MKRKKLLILLCAMGLAMCLAADVQGVGGKIYGPAEFYQVYGAPPAGSLDVYQQGMTLSGEPLICDTSYEPTPTIRVGLPGGGGWGLAISLQQPGFVPDTWLGTDPIELAGGGYAAGGEVSGMLNIYDAAGVQTSQTLIPGGIPSAITQADDGTIWAAGGLWGGTISQHDLAGNLLQSFTNPADGFDLVNGMDSYNGEIYFVDGGRIQKFDPADPDPFSTLTVVVPYPAVWDGWMWDTAGLVVQGGRIYSVRNNGDEVIQIFDAATGDLIQEYNDLFIDTQDIKGIGVQADGSIIVGVAGSQPGVMRIPIIPEPTTMILLGLGSIAMLRRKRS